MKRRMQLLVGCLGVLATASSAMATTYFSYSPTQGVPWTPGASSFDFTNWSFVDNVLTNNSGSARTWTVSLTVMTSGIVSTPIAFSAVMANSSAGTTTGQGVTNFDTGARQTSLNPVGAFSTNLQTYGLGTATVPPNGTAFVNFVVAGSAGRIARTRLTLTQ